jgi:hypothetical protein
MINMQFSKINLSKSGAEVLLYYEKSSIEEKRALKDEVAQIVQEDIIKPFFSSGGLEAKLEDDAGLAFEAYDKNTFKRTFGVEGKQGGLNPLYCAILDIFFKIKGDYTLAYRYSAYQYDEGPVIMSLYLCIGELIESWVHESMHQAFFKDLPTSKHYYDKEHPEARDIEECAVAYATCKILEHLVNEFVQYPEVSRHIQEYKGKQTLMEERERDYFTELEFTKLLEGKNRDISRRMIAQRFYKETKSNYLPYYRLFFNQVKEEETDRILSYIIFRSSYSENGTLYKRIDEIWEQSSTLKEFAERTGRDLFYEMAGQNRKLNVQF